MTVGDFSGSLSVTGPTLTNGEIGGLPSLLPEYTGGAVSRFGDGHLDSVMIEIGDRRRAIEPRGLGGGGS
jgi:hypothetical protein